MSVTDRQQVARVPVDGADDEVDAAAGAEVDGELISEAQSKKVKIQTLATLQ